MWIVAKYKSKELETLKQSFSKIIGDMPEFYTPKIKQEYYINNQLKITKKNILSNYIICKHTKFKDLNFLSRLKNSRGLIYLLKNPNLNQNSLENFIKFCKSHEDSAGFLKQTFFQITKKTKAKFISGPLTQMIFSIIEDEGKKLKILLNNMTVTVPKNSSNLLYNYI
jgi:hypothetical protein